MLPGKMRQGATHERQMPLGGVRVVVVRLAGVNTGDIGAARVIVVQVAENMPVDGLFLKVSPPEANGRIVNQRGPAGLSNLGVPCPGGNFRIAAGAATRRHDEDVDPVAAQPETIPKATLSQP